MTKKTKDLLSVLSGLIKANTRLGNALRKYKQTITLNPEQKEVNALRAPLLALFLGMPLCL